MRSYLLKKVYGNGSDILRSSNMQKTKSFVQHGSVSCFHHSLSVACMSLWIAEKLSISYDQRSLIRGALLHDYYLYDWHIKEEARPLHGFAHAGIALQNAQRDFNINEIESNVIARHMFPLNWRPPTRRESVIVCLADKLCAIREIFSHRSYRRFT